MGDEENTNPGRRSVMPVGLAHRVRALEDRVDDLTLANRQLRLAVHVVFLVLIANGIFWMWHR